MVMFFGTGYRILTLKLGLGLIIIPDLNWSLFLPPENIKNKRFPDVCRGYRKRLTRNGLRVVRPYRTLYLLVINNPANIYFFKVNNRNTRKRCEIFSSLTIQTLERRHWRRWGVFIVNFEHMSHLFLQY